MSCLLSSCFLPWTSTSPKTSSSRAFEFKRPEIGGSGNPRPHFGGALEVESQAFLRARLVAVGHRGLLFGALPWPEQMLHVAGSLLAGQAHVYGCFLKHYVSTPPHGGSFKTASCWGGVIPTTDNMAPYSIHGYHIFTSSIPQNHVSNCMSA